MQHRKEYSSHFVEKRINDKKYLEKRKDLANYFGNQNDRGL